MVAATVLRVATCFTIRGTHNNNAAWLLPVIVQNAVSFPSAVESIWSIDPQNNPFVSKNPTKTTVATKHKCKCSYSYSHATNYISLTKDE